jgi:hypothetical protein
MLNHICRVGRAAAKPTILATLVGLASLTVVSHPLYPPYMKVKKLVKSLFFFATKIF